MSPRSSRFTILTWLTAAAVAVALAAAPLAADEAKKPDAAKPAAKKAAAKPAMSPEEKQKAAMDAMMKAMTPGAQQKHLMEDAGSWTFHAKFWMAPGQPPTESEGTAERTALLGGRVLEEKVTSTFMQQPFEGMGLTGYDNVTKKWWGTWNDNMSTGVMLSTGTCNEAFTHCDFHQKMSDPMTGKVTASRATIDHSGPDTQVMKSYGPGPDGKEFLMMELTYTRKKG